MLPPWRRRRLAIAGGLWSGGCPDLRADRHRGRSRGYPLPEKEGRLQIEIAPRLLHAASGHGLSLPFRGISAGPGPIAPVR